MKKLLTFFKSISKSKTQKEYKNQFIFIEKDINGNISVEINKNVTEKDIIDITAQYYREVINPILKKQYKEKQDKRHSERAVNKLIGNIEGIILN